MENGHLNVHVLCMRAEVHCAYHTLQVNGPFLGLVAFAPVEPSWRSIKAVCTLGISIRLVKDILEQGGVTQGCSNTATMSATRLTLSE